MLGTGCRVLANVHIGNDAKTGLMQWLLKTYQKVRHVY